MAPMQCEQLPVNRLVPEADLVFVFYVQLLLSLSSQYIKPNLTLMRAALRIQSLIQSIKEK